MENLNTQCAHVVHLEINLIIWAYLGIFVHGLSDKDIVMTLLAAIVKVGARFDEISRHNSSMADRQVPPESRPK